MFYPSDNGTPALTYSDPSPVPPGSSRNYFTPSSPPGLPSPFIGSAVVSSDQPMACNVNTQRNDAGVGSSGTPARIGTSESVGTPGTTLYAPQLFKSFGDGVTALWGSYLAVQNADSSTITVAVSYKDRFGTAYPAATESVSIPPQSNHIFTQTDNANLPSNFLGSATVTNTTSGKMAGVGNFYNGAFDATSSQFHSYTTLSAGANKLYLPRFVRNYYGFNGGLSIQNIGADTTVTITFTFNGTPYTYTSGNIVSGSNLALYAPNISALSPVDALAVNLRSGNAVVQAAPGGQIVAIVNEDNRGTCNAASCPAIPSNQIGWGSTYEAFSDGGQTGTVFFMQILSHVGASTDYSGGWQIVNTSGSSGTCDIQWPSSPGANESSVAIAGNGSLFRYAPNVAGLSNPYNASAKVICTVPVFGVSNFAARNSSYFGDTFGTATGINQ